MWAAGVHTEQEEEEEEEVEVEVEEGRRGSKCLWVHLTSLRAAGRDILIKKKRGILALYLDPEWLLVSPEEPQ